MPEYGDYSTPRVSRFRLHQNGDHSLCGDSNNCKQAEELYYLNKEHLLAVAIFAELDNRGIDPKRFFGDEYERVRELARLELPDYDYLAREPDFVHRIQARGDVNDQLLTKATSR